MVTRVTSVLCKDCYSWGPPATLAQTMGQFKSLSRARTLSSMVMASSDEMINAKLRRIQSPLFCSLCFKVLLELQLILTAGRNNWMTPHNMLTYCWE